ncbi:toxin-antitoxin system YwqK family antitoxin [Fusobacterium pseudoperiodonticum]|uniref:toxin-antitoxin system YwqK family antitoxin n=1 Tax=Fusobacterium pseudoperiodonticum TaxID=2663009 RepID=UPI000C1B4A23|nr:hypothetical protein [Fusobacterium pseudoperiodonticum]ATV57423.1 hypothetical protein CTM68_06930 [Fusobacterium pseudoperiodonticum]PIM77062.1 hypothetical protein CTM69_09550 [Fusobacterium pseudoperiodonticum]
MKKIMIFLFAFCSLLAYSAKTVDYQEVDKYVRQKLDKDKEITFTYKLNQADFTLEGYSDGKLTAVTDLSSNPGQAAMDGMKSVISEKNGKLNPEYKIFAADGKLLSEQKFKLNKSIRLFDTANIMAYLDGDIPYDDRLMELFNAVDTMETIGYHPNNVKYIKKIYVNHKNNTVKMEVKDYRENPMMLQVANIDIKTLSGKNEIFYPNGKLFSSMNVKNGKINGIVTTYSEDGKVIKKIEVKDGEFVREIQ